MNVRLKTYKTLYCKIYSHRNVENTNKVVTHLGVRERIPIAVANLTSIGEPHKDPVHLKSTIRVGPACHVAAGLSEVCLAICLLTTGL